jgi:hypothetical protein
MALLLLNLMYLVIACSCVFAVLKRGYFILIYGGPQEGDALPQWEAFLRVRRAKFGYIAWNIDNYYLVVLYLLGFVMSAFLLWYGVTHSKGLIRWSVIGLGFSHLIPMWALLKAGRLSEACAEIATVPDRG